jgi:uncharacterized radical SAM superfamily protein
MLGPLNFEDGRIIGWHYFGIIGCICSGGVSTCRTICDERHFSQQQQQQQQQYVAAAAHLGAAAEAIRDKFSAAEGDTEDIQRFGKEAPTKRSQGLGRKASRAENFLSSKSRTLTTANLNEAVRSSRI